MNQRTHPRRNFTLPPEDADRLDDLSRIGRYGSKSQIVAIGLHHVWTAHQAEAIAELQVAAAATFGDDAAFVITGPGDRDLKLGQVQYDGRLIAKDDEGRVLFSNDRTPAWNFEDAGWDARSRWGYTTWDFRVIRNTVRQGEALVTSVGIQVVSGQGTSPLGHKPLIAVAEGTHVGERFEDRALVPIWEWGHRGKFADDDGRELASVLPPLTA